MSRRWLLILASIAFVGWLSYLAYAAMTKNRGPVISRAQAAAATAAVVAELSEPGKPARVLERLRGDAPEAGDIEVANLARTKGFDSPGHYLLLLTREHGVWFVVGQQRSPGNDLAGVGPPLIYPWTDRLRKQFEELPK